MIEKVVLGTCAYGGKKKYSKRLAQEVANRRANEGIRLRVYQCPNCNCFHLTHQIKEGVYKIGRIKFIKKESRKSKNLIEE